MGSRRITRKNIGGRQGKKIGDKIGGRNEI
jgi:hypothetical protein